MSRNKLRLGLVAKITLYFALFGLVIVMIFFGVFRLLIVPTIEENYLTRLRDLTLTTANLINVDDNEAIVVNGLGEDSPEYQGIKTILKKVVLANPQIDSIYTLVKTKDPDTAMFVVDSIDDDDKNGNGVLEPEETYGRIGEQYDISSNDIFKKGFYVTAAELKPYTDKWGTFISVVTPLKNSKGALVGELAADISYTNFKLMLSEFVMKVYLIFGLLILFTLLLGVLIGKIIVRKIKVVADIVTRMAESTSTEYLVVNSNDEIGKVYSIINELVKEFRSSKERMSEEVAKQTEHLHEKLSELEKLNKLMIGRELVMAELKKQIKEINGKSKS